VTPEERKQLVLDYHRTFLSTHGQNVLADLSKLCRETQSTFVIGSPDQSAFFEGGRNVMIYIRQKLAAKPEGQEPTRALTEGESDA